MNVLDHDPFNTRRLDRSIKYSDPLVQTWRSGTVESTPPELFSFFIADLRLTLKISESELPVSCMTEVSEQPT